MCSHESHLPSFTTLFVEVGYLDNLSTGRIGRETKFPSQLKHTPFKISVAMLYKKHIQVYKLPLHLIQEVNIYYNICSLALFTAYANSH